MVEEGALEVGSPHPPAAVRPVRAASAVQPRVPRREARGRAAGGSSRGRREVIAGSLQKDAQILEKAGIKSAQIVSVHNAPQALVTITRVTMEPKATSARHRHPHSEQIWLVERGTATLLLDAGQVAEMVRAM